MEAQPTSGGFEEQTRATRRKRFFAAPHRRLALTLAVSILLACGVVVAAAIEMDQAQAPIDQLQRRYVPASDALQESAQVLTSITPTYLDALGRPPAERALLLASLVAPNTKYQSAFDRYVQHAAGLPGERALQHQFRVAAQASSDTSVGLLGTETLSAAQVTTAMGYNAAMTRSLTALRGLYTERIAAETNTVDHAQQRARAVLLLSALAVFVLVLGAAMWIVRSLRREMHKNDVQAERNELEARLQRALGMVESEDDVYATVGAAVRSAVPATSVELLVADSSRAHLHQVAASNLTRTGRCPVGAPTSCPAAVHGQTQCFGDSGGLDACPHLRNREGGPIAAVCVPVTITGRPMGVLHATSPRDKAPSSEDEIALELIARRAGERLSMLRAFARSEMQAHTDPLTGLLNRRSIEASAQDLVEAGDPFVVAYADLDHFKALNDVHGHDAGDRALRLFARVLRDSIRPSDLPARYGGEEFLVVLPECSATDAAAVMERVRANLQAALIDGGGPDFTVSVGIAASSVTSTFSEIAEHADHALLQAKASGRNRVVIVGSPLVEVPDDPSSLTADDDR